MFKRVMLHLDDGALRVVVMRNSLLNRARDASSVTPTIALSFLVPGDFTTGTEKEDGRACRS
jgi:hypothetical protein